MILRLCKITISNGRIKIKFLRFRFLRFRVTELPRISDLNMFMTHFERWSTNTNNRCIHLTTRYLTLHNITLVTWWLEDPAYREFLSERFWPSSFQGKRRKNWKLNWRLALWFSCSYQPVTIMYQRQRPNGWALYICTEEQLPLRWFSTW